LQGKPEYNFEWIGAKWLFSSQDNLNLFKADPEKFAPQYGGLCALGVSEGYISRKPANGHFEVMDGKLYLFPDGNWSSNGAYNGWWQTGGGPKQRIADGDLNWPKLKARLESR
jgi:YHS domain-containing protein